MAIFDGLDIPLELETLFNKLLSLGNNSASLGKRPTPSSGDTLKKRVLNNRSLFLLWQSLYDGFDPTRKSAWQTYWATLPFGSHSGGNGWPGSGYSAFVYINAPLYKAGSDLQLDPPSGNLIRNPTFLLPGDEWDFEDAPEWTCHDGYASSDTGSNGLFQLVNSLFAGTYRIEFDVSGSNGGGLLYGLIDVGPAYDSPSVVDGHEIYEGLCSGGDGTFILAAEGFIGDITNVSLTLL